MSELFAFVFPGQGSQTVGMGADVYRASPAARAVYQMADAALGFPLSTLCFEGPEERLRETIHTQPAIVTTSLALLAALQEAAQTRVQEPSGDEAGRPVAPALAGPLVPAYVAGHSVGEYAALCAAGALNLADTLRLVRERGRLMHAAGSACPSSMAAALGMDHATLDAVCVAATRQARAELGVSPATPEEPPGAGTVVIANDNAPGQLVLSGGRRALELAMDLAKERGAKRVIPLAVSGAFHSPVMAPAARGLAVVVARAPLAATHVPIISNISAAPIASPDELRRELARQIESPVQWTQTIAYLAAHGVMTFVEVGVGQVLAGLIKRIAKGATTLTVSTAEDVTAVARRLRADSV